MGVEEGLVEWDERGEIGEGGGSVVVDEAVAAEDAGDGWGFGGEVAEEGDGVEEVEEEGAGGERGEVGLGLEDLAQAVELGDEGLVEGGHCAGGVGWRWVLIERWVYFG